MSACYFWAMTQSGSDPSRRVAGLAKLLEESPAVEAVRLPNHGRSVLVATLGQVDEDELADHLHEVLARAEETFGPASRTPGLRLTTSEEGIELSRPSCPTSRHLWRWREIPVVEEAEEEDLHGDEWKEMAVFAAVCALFGVIGWVLQHAGGLPPWISVTCFAAAIVAGGWDAAKDTWHELRQGVLDIHFLMLAAAAGSAALGAWGEGALLLFLFSSAGALEHFALHRTRREISALFKTAPKTATLVDADGNESSVAVDRIRPGDLLAVKPGDQFAVDAEVVAGETAADESNLTGEAHPVQKGVGDEVSSGTINLWGAVRVRALRPARRSALQKIIGLIREAQKTKAPSQRLTDRFGTGYTYAVLGATLAIFLVWWLVFKIPPFRNHEHGYSAFYRAMTLMVVASPCALVLSIPSAILAAIAWGARHGILFRGGAAVEKLAVVDTVCLDKTGTLTTGEHQVMAIESFPPGREDAVASLAFALESNSTHPIARAITAYGKANGLDKPEVTNFQSITGHGLRGEADGARILLGKRDLLGGGALAERLRDVPWPPPGHTEVWVVAEDLVGRILMRDQVRTESKSVLETLARRGITARMLTGDRPEAAGTVAAEIGLPPDLVMAGLKPEQKVEEIRRLTDGGRKVAMVGDGVNDAPALAAADLGIAMGAAGTDAALDTADIALMGDDLTALPLLLRLSRRTGRIIRQNIAVSIVIKAVFLVLAPLGLTSLWLAVFADMGTSLLVTGNGLRLHRD